MIAGLTPPFYCRSNQLAEEQHNARDPANPLTFLSYILPGAKPSFRHNVEVHAPSQTRGAGHESLMRRLFNSVVLSIISRGPVIRSTGNSPCLVGPT